jgi:hypothetical protein
MVLLTVVDFFDTGMQNLFSDTTNASIPVVTTLRSSLSIYVFFIYNQFLYYCSFCEQLTGGYSPSSPHVICIFADT